MPLNDNKGTTPENSALYQSKGDNDQLRDRIMGDKKPIHASKDGTANENSDVPLAGPSLVAPTEDLT